MTHPRLGVTFASLMPLGPRVAVDTARQAAELGYRSFWTAETTGPEAFSESSSAVPRPASAMSEPVCPPR